MRRAPSKEDQEAFNGMFKCAKLLLQAEIRLGRPRRFEVVLAVVLLESENRVEEMLKILEELNAGNE